MPSRIGKGNFAGTIYISWKGGEFHFLHGYPALLGKLAVNTDKFLDSSISAKLIVNIPSAMIVLPPETFLSCRLILKVDLPKKGNACGLQVSGEHPWDNLRQRDPEPRSSVRDDMEDPRCEAASHHASSRCWLTGSSGLWGGNWHIAFQFLKSSAGFPGDSLTKHTLFLLSPLCLHFTEVK